MSTWDSLATRLEGQVVVLEPIEARHRDGLWAAAQHPEIWDWLARIGTDRSYFDQWFDATLARTQAGQEGALVTLLAVTDEVVGSTRYLNARPPDRVVEIGWTWLCPEAWGTGANVEAKLLMLEHAFTTLGCVRVEFKTDARNERSRRALQAIPAQFEGVLRKHMTMPDVGVRDSAYFSVIDDEWPRVRDNLRSRLARATGRS